MESSLKNFLIFISISVIIAFIIVGHQKNHPLHSSQDSFSTPESIISDLFARKLDYVLHFEDRDKILMPDVFVDDELKNAVRYRFLDAAEFGRVTQYSHEVSVLNAEEQTLNDGSIILPAMESVSSVMEDPTSEPAGPIRSGYTDKLFFHFINQQGAWKITKIEILKEEFENTTPYSEGAVTPYAPTRSEMEERGKTDEEFRIISEERKIWEAYYDEKIDLIEADKQFHDLYEKNGLLPKS